MTLIWTDNPQAQEAGNGWLDGDLQARAEANAFQLFVCGPHEPHRAMLRHEAVAMAKAILAYFEKVPS